MPLVEVSAFSLAHEASKAAVSAMTFSPDGSALYVARWPRVFGYRVADGALVTEIDLGNLLTNTELSEDDDATEFTQKLVCSPDGATLYVLSQSYINNNGDTFGWVQAHACESGALLWMFPAQDSMELGPAIDEETGITDVIPSPDGAQLALLSPPGVTMVAVRTGKQLAEIDWPDGGDEPYDHLSGACFSSDGSQIWLAWPPRLLCCSIRKNRLKLQRLVSMRDERTLLSDQATALACVRESDGRLTVIDRDRTSVYSVGPKDTAVTPVTFSGDFFVLALLEEGSRWLRCSRARREGFTGPLAIESATDVRVLSEPEGAPTKWQVGAVCAAKSLLVARVDRERAWVHRAVED